MVGGISNRPVFFVLSPPSEFLQLSVAVIVKEEEGMVMVIVGSSPPSPGNDTPPSFLATPLPFLFQLR